VGALTWKENKVGVVLLETNYARIARKRLSRLFARLPIGFESMLQAEKSENRFCFRAFGEDCCLGPDMITLSGKHIADPRVVLISLYAGHANPEPVRLEPFMSFRDLPNSMPYQGAFRANSESVLISHVRSINDKQQTIKDTLDGQDGLSGYGGDLSFILFPLPKIALCYIFYLLDEEFPASATCLFSANALSFMPIDGLADVAEHTSKRIVQLISE
jgi:hypothetical protein